MSAKRTPTSIVAENAAKDVLEHLKKGVKPWIPNVDRSHLVGRPKNISGYHYTNYTNEFILSVKQMLNPDFGYMWATQKQIKDKGGTITPSERSKGTILIRYFKKYQDLDDLDLNGKPIIKPFPFDPVEAKRIEDARMPIKWIPVYSRAYNIVGQTSGMPSKFYKKPFQYDPSNKKHLSKISDAINLVLSNNEICIDHTKNRKLIFTPHLNLATDKIHIPAPEHFNGGFARYASTLLHECGHFSGISRLLGFLPKRIDSERHRAADELRAEMVSIIGANQLKFPLKEHIENHSSYIDSWIEALEQDPRFIMDVSKDAGLSFDLLNNNKPEYNFLFEACQNEFEKHTVAMCIAKSKDPETTIEKICDLGKVPGTFFISKYHMASLLVSFPNEINGAEKNDFSLEIDRDDMNTYMKNYHNQLIEASQNIVHRLDMAFDAEFGKEKPANDLDSLSVSIAPGLLKNSL